MQTKPYSLTDDLLSRQFGSFWVGFLVGAIVAALFVACQYLPNQNIPPEVLTLNASTPILQTASPRPEDTQTATAGSTSTAEPPTPTMTLTSSIEELPTWDGPINDGVVTVLLNGSYTPSQDQPVLFCGAMIPECETSITLRSGSPVMVYALAVVMPDRDKYLCVDLPTFGDPTQWGYCGRLVAWIVEGVEYGTLATDN